MKAKKKKGTGLKREIEKLIKYKEQVISSMKRISPEEEIPVIHHNY